ncbi:MAG: hypothetical protein AAFP90_15435, partial [Planctomycetota bacterium]
AAKEECAMNRGEVTRALLLTILAQILFGGCLAIALPTIVPMLLGDDFRPSVPFALLLLPATGLRGVMLVGDSYLKGRQRSRPGIVGRFFGFLTMLLVTGVGFSQLQIWSVPIGLGAGQFVCLSFVAVAMYQLAQRQDDTTFQDAIDDDSRET